MTPPKYKSPARKTIDPSKRRIAWTVQETEKIVDSLYGLYLEHPGDLFIDLIRKAQKVTLPEHRQRKLQSITQVKSLKDQLEKRLKGHSETVRRLREAEAELERIKMAAKTAPKKPDFTPDEVIAAMTQSEIIAKMKELDPATVLSTLNLPDVAAYTVRQIVAKLETNPVPITQGPGLAALVASQRKNDAGGPGLAELIAGPCPPPARPTRTVCIVGALAGQRIEFEKALGDDYDVIVTQSSKKRLLGKASRADAIALWIDFIDHTTVPLYKSLYGDRVFLAKGGIMSVANALRKKCEESK